MSFWRSCLTLIVTEFWKSHLTRLSQEPHINISIHPRPICNCGLLYHNIVTNVDQICHWSAIFIYLIGKTHLSYHQTTPEHLCLEGALGPVYSDLSRSYTFANKWMNKRYQHTKLEPTGCLDYEKTAGPLYFIAGPGPHSLTKLACIYVLECVNGQALWSLQIRAYWPFCLKRNSRPFILP